MARGFFWGALKGVALSAIVVGGASVATGPVFAPQPDANATGPEVAAPQAPAVDAPPMRTPEAPSQPNLAAETTSPGLPDEPEVADIPGLETAPAPVPETAPVTEGPDVPDAPDNVATRPQDDTIVLPSPRAVQPTAPATEDLSITTNPAQPPLPLIPEGTDVVRGAEPTPSGPASDMPSSVAETAPAIDSEIDPEIDPSGDAAPGEGTQAQAPTTRDTPAQDVSSPDSITDIVTDTNTPLGGDQVDQTLVETGEIGSVGVMDMQAEDAPDVTASPPPVLPQIGEAGEVSSSDVSSSGDLLSGVDALVDVPNIGAGTSDLAALAPEIPTNRLPTTGTSDAPEAQTLQAPPETANVPVQNALTEFAIPPAQAPDRPLMSIVLIDGGTAPLGLEALEAFPYPLTFAIDTTWVGAPEAMARYRAAGFEVMALADVPLGATPSDVEVSLRAALDVVPEAVAVLEGARTGLQSSRDVSEQVAQVLSESGHGLVLYPEGLNTAVSLAQRAGLKADALFRDFDAQDQTATVIRRFLDQAAFKAGQEGGVIMVGRLRADTITALLLWGLQDRASRVSLVPISTLLLQQGTP